MAERLGNFIFFLALTIVTFGIYPLYFFVTRQQEMIVLLTDIKAGLIVVANEIKDSK